MRKLWHHIQASRSTSAWSTINNNSAVNNVIVAPSSSSQVKLEDVLDEIKELRNEIG